LLYRLTAVDLAGPGIAAEVLAIVEAQEAALGVPKPKRLNTAREIQARRLWDLGIGRALKYESFEAYLATIPEPAEEIAEKSYLTLVEPRIDLQKLCELAHIQYALNNRVLTYAPRHFEFTEPTWIVIDPGRGLRRHTVSEYMEALANGEFGLTALQGIFAYIHQPSVLGDLEVKTGLALDLPGSRLENTPWYVACLRSKDGLVSLGHRDGSQVEPQYCPATREIMP
jgi:hypothetical protein